MVNETITQQIIDVHVPIIWHRMLELIKAPTQNTEMLWITIPLVLTLFLMQFYFVKYTREQLGWNAAVANTLVLVFVSLDLFRFIFHYSAPPSFLNWLLFPVKSLIAFIVVIEGLLLFFADFLHFLPKRIAFFISSSLPVNLTAYLAIVLVYTGMEITTTTILAAVMLFFILLLFFSILRIGHRMMHKQH